MRIYNYKIPILSGLLVDAYAKHMLSILDNKVYPTITCPALYRHIAKKIESNRKFIIILAGPNICTLIPTF